MQLTPLDVDYQREERAKTRAELEELKKPRVIPRVKPNTNFSFKLAYVDLASQLQQIDVSHQECLGFWDFLRSFDFFKILSLITSDMVIDFDMTLDIIMLAYLFLLGDQKSTIA